MYKSTNRSEKAGDNATISVTGGLLTGGGSWDGAGGIHIKKGSTVTLKDVTIAGCRSQQKKSKKGYGGGIYLSEGSITLNLENSTITGCFAYNDGGGIYADDHGNVAINLVNSHVDNNFANSDGGGINPDGENTKIKGDGKSTVSNNACGSRGGGILAYDSGCEISDLVMKGNKGGEGGAIYATNPDFGPAQTLKTGLKVSATTLKNLVIDDNTATSKGGGVYVRTSGNTITSCTIENNKAPRAGGVYVHEDTEFGFKIDGKTFIRNNKTLSLRLSSSCWQSPSPSRFS